jgi:hypothetical protein
MPRPAKFTPDAILKAASEIVATRGPGATTMGEIAAKIGAPSGSLYHRFQSRDELLGRLWLLSFKTRSRVPSKKSILVRLRSKQPCRYPEPSGLISREPASCSCIGVRTS